MAKRARETVARFFDLRNHMTPKDRMAIYAATQYLPLASFRVYYNYPILIGLDFREGDLICLLEGQPYLFVIQCPTGLHLSRISKNRMLPSEAISFLQHNNVTDHCDFINLYPPDVNYSCVNGIHLYGRDWLFSNVRFTRNHNDVYMNTA